MALAGSSTSVFWHSTLVFPERGAPGQKKLAKKTQFLTLESRIPAERCSQKIKSQKTLCFWHFWARKKHFPWEGLRRARFSWLLGCAKIEKKRKAREREGERWWWWWWWDDDDDEMMMMIRWLWWWDDDDDDEMMMISRRIPEEIFKRNPSQALSGTRSAGQWRLTAKMHRCTMFCGWLILSPGETYFATRRQHSNKANMWYNLLNAKLRLEKERTS